MKKQAYMLIAALALVVLAGCSAPGQVLDPNADRQLGGEPFVGGIDPETGDLILPEYKDEVINGHADR